MNVDNKNNNTDLNKFFNSFLPNEEKNMVEKCQERIKSNIELILKFNPYYKKIINSFFPKNDEFVNVNIEMPFNIPKIEECKNLIKLDFLDQSTAFFLTFLVQFDLTWIEKIKDNIIKEPGENFKWTAKIFNDLSNINSAISFVLYRHLHKFEKHIKNVVLKFFITTDFELIKFKKDDSHTHSSELNIFLKNNPDIWKEKWKYNSFFNVLTFADFIDLIKSISDDLILSHIFEYLFGEAKYNLLKGKNNDVYNLKKIVVDNFEIIRDLRNKVMHFSWIMPDNDQNLLTKSIKALNFFSQQFIGNEPQIGDEIYREVINIITTYIGHIDHPVLYQYFSDFFYKYDLYKFTI